MKKIADCRSKDVFVLQIGAMDGKTFDPVYEFITGNEWSALVVEPMPGQFAALKTNYATFPQVRLANVAVSEHNGTAMLYYTPEALIDNETVPKWGLGASSLYPDRNALAFDEVKPHVEKIDVACLTLRALLEQNEIKHIDVLQIDTEGHDYHILKQLDFAHYRPWVMNIEIVNLPKAEKTALKKLLDEQGYLHTKAGYDLLAVRMDFFETFK